MHYMHGLPKTEWSMWKVTYDVLIHEPIYQHQHLNSDIHRFQACSSVLFKLEVPGLFVHRYLALLLLLKCMCMRRYRPVGHTPHCRQLHDRTTGDILEHRYYSTVLSKQVWQRTVTIENCYLASHFARGSMVWPSVWVRWRHSHSA